MKQEEQLRQEFHNVLRRLTPSEDLNRRVFERIEQVEQMNHVPIKRVKRWKQGVVAAVVLLLLAGSVLQVPTVKAAVLPSIAAVVMWVQEVTKIPIRIPSSWQSPEGSKQQSDSHYYFEAFRTPQDYSINVYYVKVPVPFNNEQALLAKDGPLSESQKEGSISGKQKTADMKPLTLTIPPDAKPFELIPGVTAYVKEQGTQVDWQQGHWGFEYSGPTQSEDALKQVASLWEGTFKPLADTGTVQMVQGNHLTLLVTWDEGNVRYEFRTGDLKHLPDMLSSLREWKQETNQ